MNMQPSEAEAGFDIRLPPTEDPALLSRRVSNEWAPSSRNMTFQVRNLVWITLLTWLHFPPCILLPIQPNSVEADNQGIIYSATNQAFCECTKDIEIDCRYICEKDYSED